MFVRVVPTIKEQNTCNSTNNKSQIIIITKSTNKKKLENTCNSTNKKVRELPTKRMLVRVPTKRVREYL